MTNIITRFAPSPTGYLHVGNIRTALINWLYAHKHGGQFLLRMDDTDVIRSKDEYKDSIIQDLQWLNLTWHNSFNQLDRLSHYKKAQEYLISQKRLYPCYETPEELDFKRKLQLSRGMPPIYDRSALKLTDSGIAKYEAQGRKPHYRFRIDNAPIIWDDLIKGEIKYQGHNLSDPIIIRENGSMTYMLCSIIDDMEFNISHIIRGEDHISNTAIQIQMFQAFDAASIPTFAHLSLMNAKDDKMSKRSGGFDVKSLRDQDGIEAMTINSFLTFIGSSDQMNICTDMDQLIEKFDISKYSKSPTTYVPEELNVINHKLILQYNYEHIRPYLITNNLAHITEEFWLAVRPNLSKLLDLKEWWTICHHPIMIPSEDPELLQIASKTLPKIVNHDTWKEWTQNIAKLSGRKGKKLFMPLRIALTGKSFGPELKDLLPLLKYNEIIKRLLNSM